MTFLCHCSTPIFSYMISKKWKNLNGPWFSMHCSNNIMCDLKFVVTFLTALSHKVCVWMTWLKLPIWSCYHHYCWQMISFKVQSHGRCIWPFMKARENLIRLTGVECVAVIWILSNEIITRNSDVIVHIYLNHFSSPILFNVNMSSMFVFIIFYADKVPVFFKGNF